VLQLELLQSQQGLQPPLQGGKQHQKLKLLRGASADGALLPGKLEVSQIKINNKLRTTKSISGAMFVRRLGCWTNLSMGAFD
jgi:hypothetical protein